MAGKTLEEKVDDLGEKISGLTTELKCHLTEFKIFKKVGYALLLGVLGILGKLYWRAIVNSPTIIANVVALMNNTTP